MNDLNCLKVQDRYNYEELQPKSTLEFQDLVELEENRMLPMDQLQNNPCGDWTDTMLYRHKN